MSLKRTDVVVAGEGVGQVSLWPPSIGRSTHLGNLGINFETTRSRFPLEPQSRSSPGALSQRLNFTLGFTVSRTGHTGAVSALCASGDSRARAGSADRAGRRDMRVHVRISVKVSAVDSIHSAHCPHRADWDADVARRGRASFG